MALHIVTDSTCDLPKSIVTELDLTVVPCNVHIGDETLLDGVDVTPGDFYKRLVEKGTTARTSQPSVGSFIGTYNRIGWPGEEILSLHISAKLSGTYNSAFQAAKEAQSRAKIEVVDTESVSLGVGFLVREVGKIAKVGGTLKDATEFLKKEIPNIDCFATIDTLKYLIRGGRANRLQGFFGSMLDIKPVISVRFGEAHPVDRVRTRKRALERMLEEVGKVKKLKALGIIHSACADDANAFADQCGKFFPRDKMIVAECTPAIGAHFGPRSIGVALWKGDEK